MNLLKKLLCWRFINSLKLKRTSHVHVYDANSNICPENYQNIIVGDMPNVVTICVYGHSFGLSLNYPQWSLFGIISVLLTSNIDHEGEFSY